MRKLDPVKHEKKRQEILEAAKRCAPAVPDRYFLTAEVNVAMMELSFSYSHF